MWLRGEHVGWQGAVWPEREATARPDGGDFAGAQGDLFAAAIAFSIYPERATSRTATGTGRRGCRPVPLASASSGVNLRIAQTSILWEPRWSQGGSHEPEVYRAALGRGAK